MSSPYQAGTTSKELTYFKSNCRIHLCANSNENSNDNNWLWLHIRSHRVPIPFTKSLIYYWASKIWKKRLAWSGHLVLGQSGIALYRILLERIEEKYSIAESAKKMCLEPDVGSGPLLYRLSLNWLKWQCPICERTQITASSHVHTLENKLNMHCSCFHGTCTECYIELHFHQKIQEAIDSIGMKLSPYRSFLQILWIYSPIFLFIFKFSNNVSSVWDTINCWIKCREKFLWLGIIASLFQHFLILSGKIWLWMSKINGFPESSIQQDPSIPYPWIEHESLGSDELPGERYLTSLFPWLQKRNTLILNSRVREE